MSHDVGGRKSNSRGKQKHYTSTRQSKLYNAVQDNKMAKKKIGSANTDVQSNSSSSKSLRSKCIKKKVQGKIISQNNPKPFPDRPRAINQAKSQFMRNIEEANEIQDEEDSDDDSSSQINENSKIQEKPPAPVL